MENSRMEMSLEEYDFESTEAPAHRRSGHSTIDALIAQNEDTQSRLNVTLRRLAQVEDEKQDLLSKNKKMSDFFSSYTDQIEVWKEKEKIWNEKNEELEAELQSLRTAQFNLNDLRIEADRYRRYHEKIKTQVKPYIQQLKSYAQSLKQQLENLKLQIDHKDSQIRQLAIEIKDSKENFEKQHEESYILINQVTQSFEEQRSSMLDELQRLTEQNGALYKKSLRLDEALIRQDELENTVITLRHQLVEKSQHNEIEIENLRKQSSQTQQQNVEYQLITNDLRQEIEQLKKQSIATLGQKVQLEEQLTSLRYQWTNKCQETDRLYQSIQSLEKINLDLSQKLSELRKSQQE